MNDKNKLINKFLINKANIFMLFALFILFSCGNKNGFVENKNDEIGKKQIDVNSLYNDELVTVDLNGLDEKYNNLSDRISDMKMVSEYEDDKTIEDFDTIFLGKCEQDGIYENGEEDIEWILLDKNDEYAIFQTKYIIEQMKYPDITNLSEYLNKKYIYKIFEKEEINLLKEVKDKNNIIEINGSIPLENFQEKRKIKLLTYDELVKYFGEVGAKEYNKYPNDEEEDLIEETIDIATKNNLSNNKNKTIKTNKKIITKETNYVKKVIENSQDIKQSVFYKYQSDIKVENNFAVQSDYTWIGHDDRTDYLSGLRPIIYIDLKKSKDYKFKNKYRKYTHFDLIKGKVFDKNNLKNVHKVSEYKEGTYLENVESVAIGSFDSYEEKQLKITEQQLKTTESNTTKKVKEDSIEWIVLDEKNGNYLLMAKYPIALKRFDDEGRNVNYIDSSIRKWLNEDFYNEVFDDEFKNKILNVNYKIENKNEDVNNYKKDTELDVKLNDKVFLLSSNDIIKYFSKNILEDNNKNDSNLDVKKLISKPIRINHVYVANVLKEPFNGRWNDFCTGFLLRDNGLENFLVKYVDNSGNINEEGTLNDMPYMAIRPAIIVGTNLSGSFKEEDFINTTIEDLNSKILDDEEIISNNEIYIGACEQDGDLKNGKENIEWEVIGKEDDDLILISKYILDAEKVNDEHKVCKYENTEIKKKLEKLYEEYFNEEEKNLLEERSNKNYPSILDGLNGSENTNEKLFLLSIEDIRKFLGDTTKSYDILKSENTYYLNTRGDIQKLPNDVYIDNNYFLRSVGAINYSYYIRYGMVNEINLSFNNKVLFDGYDEILWSNVDNKGQVGFIKLNTDYDESIYTEYAKGSEDLIVKQLYLNGIRPCIKVNIDKLNKYLDKGRKINKYNHKKIEKGKKFKLDEIDKVKILKENEDYVTFDNIDSIIFGKYKIDNKENTNEIENGKLENKINSTETDLEWFVLYKDDDKALLLSKYILDDGRIKYDEIWENSEVRKKLNNKFYENSFSEEEKNKILTTKIPSRNKELKETFDKIFILDQELINKYILDGDVKDKRYLEKFDRLKVSKYIKNYVDFFYEKTKNKKDNEKFKSYLLNNNVDTDNYNPYMTQYGFIHYDSLIECGIRPAIWVKLNDKTEDIYKVKKKIKKYDDNDKIEIKILKSDDISKYTEEQNVEDFDTVEFGKFFQGEEGKDHRIGKIYYYTMDTMDEYNERFLNNKKESWYISDKFQYDKSMDKKIEWIILDKNDDYAMLMSKYILYAINEDGNNFDERHNNDREFVYAESRTRKWLNEVFYNLAFNEEEKKKICQLSFEDCSQKGTNEIKTFYDNVSILNSIELAKYFGYISKNDVNKKIPTKATGYALGTDSGRTGLNPANDYRKYGFGNSNFTVRSYSITSKIINSEGKIDEAGNITGVRPVIKVSLGGTNSKNAESTNSKLYYDEELSKTIKVTKTFNESAKMGPMPDTIKFGKYEQDNNLTNGKEDIEWYVLKKENDKALIMSKDILDLQVYDYDRYISSLRESAKFDSSYLNEWLNIKFVNDAFDAKEIKNISDTVLYDEKKEYNYTKKESEIIKNYYLTKAFILTIDEINEYLNNGTKMKAGAYASKYVKGIENKAGGIFVNAENAFSPYWTRTYKAEDVYTGYNRGHVVIVDDSSYQKICCDSIDIGVRPVLWVNIN